MIESGIERDLAGPCSLSPAYLDFGSSRSEVEDRSDEIDQAEFDGGVGTALEWGDVQ